MSRFHYSGHTLDDRVVQGALVARDQAELATRLMDKGIFVDHTRMALSTAQQYVLRFMRSAEITRVTRQLHILTNSRIPVAESLLLVGEQARDHTLRSVFASIVAQVESGRAVAACFGDYPIVFDRLYTSMLESGEASAQLDFALDRIATYRERREEVARKVRSALAYPLMVILVAVLVVAALVLYVVPVFSSMYQSFDAELPALTSAVVNLSAWLRDNVWWWLSGTVILILGIITLGFAGRSKYVLHMLLVRTPLLQRLVLKLVAARFCRTMGSLLVAGVDIIEALRIASGTTGNTYVTAALGPAAELLAGGKSFTEAIETTRVFPRAVLRLAASGEKTGQLGEMLNRAADFYEKETDSEITTLTTLIEPFIIIVLGAVVAFILVAMYLPLFELVGAM